MDTCREQKDRMEDEEASDGSPVVLVSHYFSYGCFCPACRFSSSGIKKADCADKAFSHGVRNGRSSMPSLTRTSRRMQRKSYKVERNVSPLLYPIVEPETRGRRLDIF